MSHKLLPCIHPARLAALAPQDDGSGLAPLQSNIIMFWVEFRAIPRHPFPQATHKEQEQ
jgi:hypothetical protein